MRAGVIGDPVAHSLSPALHRAAYAEFGLTDWRYDAIRCDADSLAAMLAGLGPEWVALSVTMPCKRAALAAATSASRLARDVGAANTLRRRGGSWYADNTDVAGIVGALREGGVRDATGAVLLGAGGTAQAALAALRALGERRPTVLVRSVRRAGALLATARRVGVEPVLAEPLADDAVNGALYAAPVVISTLPPAAADPLADADRWTGTGTLLDVVYAPWPTRFADSARHRRTVVGGQAMLLHQAVAQVTAMTGRPAPLEVMRAALAAAAGRPASG